MTSTYRLLCSISDQCLVSGTNFLTMIIVGRACGLHELGIYALAFTVIVTLMAMQESLLIAPYTVIMSRFRKADRRADYGSATLLQQLLVGSFVSIVLLISGAGAGWLTVAADYSLLLLTMAVVAPFWLLKEFARRASYVELDTLRPLLIDGTAAVVQMVALVILWLRGELSAVSAVAAAGAGHASATALWWLVFRPVFKLKLTGFRRALWLNWSFGSWSCVGRLTDMMHAYSLHWLLAFVSGPAATGAYAAALSLLALTNPVLMGIGNLLAPETARAYAAGGAAALRRIVFRATCQVTLITAVFVVMIISCAELLLNLTFGESREGQVALVTILSLGMLGGITGFGADNGLRALARPAESFKASLIGLIVSLCVGCAVVGQWAAIGAAFAALSGDLTSTLVRIGSFLRIVSDRRDTNPAMTFKVA